MKPHTLSFAWLIGFLLLVVSAGCSKKSDPATVPLLPTVRTDTVTDITYHSARVTVSILTEGSASTLGGVVYAKSPGPTLYDNLSPGSGSGVGTFTVNLPDLQANTRYYYRAYASSLVGTVYGAEKSFMTTNDAPPYIRFLPDSATITRTELTLVGYVDSVGNSPLTSVAFLLGTQPDLSDSTEITVPAVLGRATARFTGLQPGTRYYARMRVRNERQTARSFIAFLTTQAALGQITVGSSLYTTIQYSSISTPSSYTLINEGQANGYPFSATLIVPEKPSTPGDIALSPATGIRLLISRYTTSGIREQLYFGASGEAVTASFLSGKLVLSFTNLSETDVSGTLLPAGRKATGSLSED